MKVYDINLRTSNQIHSVVAESIGKAEELYLEEYPGDTITDIELHSDYVIVQESELIEKRLKNENV